MRPNGSVRFHILKLDRPNWNQLARSETLRVPIVPVRWRIFCLIGLVCE